MPKRRRPVITITKIAIALAVVTTLLGMAASGSIVIAGGRNFEEGIHSIALSMMLIAYLFLLSVLKAARKKQIQSFSIVEQENFLVVSPCGMDNCLVLDQAGIDRTPEGSGSHNANRRRAEIRIVVARQVLIPETFLAFLAQFPNLTLLDLQDATVAPEFWANLEELPSVSHVLATNAIPSDQLRNISISLPEVKFWLGKQRRLVIGSKAAMNPSGS